MDRFAGSGELDVERGSLSGRGAYIDFSSMLFDYTVADGKAQAGAAAIGLGGEERVKNAMDVLAGNACAGIRNFHFNAAVVRHRADLQHAAARHGVPGVE